MRDLFSHLKSTNVAMSQKILFFSSGLFKYKTI